MISSAVLAILLAAAPPHGTPTPTAVTAGTPFPASVDDAPAPATQPPSDVSWTSVAVPVGFIAALGIAALVARRRRSRAGKLIQILEVANLGPKRSLILARLGSQTLLLGASEAGLQTLSTQALTEEMLAVAEASRPESDRESASVRAPSFENLLGEATEDQELRRKLAMGLAGKIQ